MVYVRISGVEYMYCLDKALHDHVFKLMKHTPGKALDYLKKACLWWEKCE